MMDFTRHDKSTINGTQSGLLEQSKLRLLFIAAVIVLFYAAIALRLVDLTLLQQETTAAAPVKTGTAVVAAGSKLRGSIVDRNGELVATSLRMASVYADATQVIDAKKTAQDLARLLPASNEDDLFKKLSSGKKFVWLARNITPRQEYAINALGHPGVSFIGESRRIYPHKNLTSHVAGYTDVDGQGIAGIERAFDRQLKEGDEPVRLSLDLRVQHILHRELSDAMKTFSAKAAVGMVTDVNTGEVIAAVSLPDFDPYEPSAASDDAKFNRCTLGVFEMGSTFKLFSTAAAVDAGTANFTTTYDATNPIKIGRFSINDSHGKKRVMTVPEIFIHSSNIGTAKMVLAMGGGKLRDFYEKMGFFAPVPVDYPERGHPIFPKTWREVNIITASFGHGVAVSPLHLMRAAGALVNGGVMVKPTFTLRDGTAPRRDRVIDAETSKKIRKLLELVVAQGTGGKARAEGYAVGGKTGTAEKIGGKGYNRKALLSSFIGFYPMNNPRYAVLAIMDEPQPTKDTYGYATGGWTAAPVVGRVIAQMAPLYQIAPDFAHVDISEEMSRYLKDPAKGKKIAVTGTDH